MAYIPPYYRITEEDEKIQHMIDHPFATVISTSHKDKEAPYATQLPLMLDKSVDGNPHRLHFHIAQGNLQWKSLGHCEENDIEVLVVFEGAHTYISPEWYQSKEVPTWNYTSVRAYGKVRMITDDGENLQMLHRLVRTSEVSKTERLGGNVWDLASLDEAHVQEQMRHIKFFTIDVRRIDGKKKMSQNRSVEDQNGVIENLAKGSGSDAAVAEIMKESLKTQK
eukprot:TRINITY_DN9912_c0_g1_i1.p1 TRINITY_DN9912_c0_g1~~TRINITY_DN9912_c0_g1_i1.p1  ORF type:complete len:223 (+),score=44.70 TRINITY_DN9912_c0_g1_i1:38-706(+)